LKPLSIRISGFGGQGIILAAVILGITMVRKGNLYVVQTQSYGSEARGGECQSDYIDEKICKGCSFCVNICPKQVYQMKNKFNNKGYVIPEVVASEKCTKCNLCELTCPELAIYIENIV